MINNIEVTAKMVKESVTTSYYAVEEQPFAGFGWDIRSEIGVQFLVNKNNEVQLKTIEVLGSSVPLTPPNSKVVNMVLAFAMYEMLQLKAKFKKIVHNHAVYIIDCEDFPWARPELCTVPSLYGTISRQFYTELKDHFERSLGHYLPIVQTTVRG